MNDRIKISTNAPWEDIIGYCRLIKVGNLIEVAGTTSVNEKGEIIGKGSPYEQTRFIIKKIENALQKVNSGLENVVRTRIFLTNMNHWREVAKAHYEFFGEIRPVNTILAVKSLIEEELLVEIEVTAISNKAQYL